MRKRSLVKHGSVPAAIAALVLVSLLWAGIGSASAQEPTEPQAVGPVLLSYQGLLVDPTTGNPKEGTYQMIFALYDVKEGAVPSLWSETRTVLVDKGLFST